MSDKYILVSLDEKKSKDLANVISNETSRKILDYLGDHEKVAPVEISKKLNIPISTVTYNLKHLKKQGLIEVKDFAWSDKGKKVELYSIAKKLILIAPKGFDWKQSLKKIIPIALIGVFGTFLLRFLFPPSFSGAKLMAQEVALDTAEESIVQGALYTQPVWYPYWLFFLIFICILIVIVIILDYRRKK